jgi:hypothetical protein
MLRASWTLVLLTIVFAVAACATASPPSSSDEAAAPASPHPDPPPTHMQTPPSPTAAATAPASSSSAAGSGGAPDAAPDPGADLGADPGAGPGADPGADPAPGADPDAAAVRTDMPVRIELRTSDEATAGFADIVMGILTDPRGWVRAGFDFREDPDGPFTIVLAEGEEVDRLCLPYDTYGLYSCQNGPVVALNADRWRFATAQWPADLDSYRVMLVNHEVGHLLHLHHPKPQCPQAGLPAPVMAQQSTTLEGCAPNPWPLQWEIDLAAARLEPLAPGADHDPSDHRPVPPPVDR